MLLTLPRVYIPRINCQLCAYPLYNEGMKIGLIVGAVFGLVAPFIGLFIGLQISVVLANILMFPIISISYVTGEPFGNWGGEMMAFALLLSMVAWSLLFGIVAKIVRR